MTYEQTTIPGNLVTFDDTATGITNINLVPTNLAPSSINVSNSVLNYTFTGSGQLTGPGGLAKNGSGALVIANTGTNSFLGSIGINGGLLQLGVSNGLPSTANITLADVTGATFDLNNFNQTIASLSGGGSDGGGNVTLGTGTLTISGSGGNYNGFISGNGQQFRQRHRIRRPGRRRDRRLAIRSKLDRRKWERIRQRDYQQRASRFRLLRQHHSFRPHHWHWRLGPGGFRTLDYPNAQ